MGLTRDYNPFANAEIRIAKSEHETLRQLSRTQGADDNGKETLEDVPFDRYVDVWLTAMALGVSAGAYTSVENLDRQRFIMGNVLDLERIELILLLAIAHTDDAFVVGDPRKVLDIAEGYVIGGIPILTEMIYTGHLTPARNLVRSLEDQIRTRRSQDK